MICSCEKIMGKLLQAFPFKSLLLPSPSQNYNSIFRKSLLSLITCSSTFSHNRACSSTSELNVKNFVLAKYLINSLKFSKHRALSISNSFSNTKSLNKTKEVVHFFKGLGCSDAHIQSIAHGFPGVLFADVEKTLKPKVIFFQELGLSGACLVSFFSRNPCIFGRSLDRSLKPCIHLIKKVLASDGRNRSKEKVNDHLLLTITRSNRIFQMKCRLEAKILYLESCGVDGSQLSGLLLRQGRIFSMSKEKLEKLVSRAINMNFPIGSRMLAPAIHCLSCTSIETLNGRFEVFRMFGFSNNELYSMFRKSPWTFGLSKAKLRCKLEFFLSKLKVDKLVLARNPRLLTYSLEDRLIPRCKVLEILKSRRRLKRDPGIIWASSMSNQQFVWKFILPFKSDAEGLLLAYGGKRLNTSEE